MDSKYNGIAWTGSTLLDVQNPTPSKIRLKDIARGLSRAYRFGGHTRDDLPPYSVAWHSLFCEKVADEMGLPVWVRLQAILHDAPEYLLGDLPTPIKVLLPGYKGLESRMWAAVAARWRLPVQVHPAVHEIDVLALEVERFHLVDPDAWEPAPVIPDRWSELAARWVAFVQTRGAQEAPLAAALFHARVRALEAAHLEQVDPPVAPDLPVPLSAICGSPVRAGA